MFLFPRLLTSELWKYLKIACAVCEGCGGASKVRFYVDERYPGNIVLHCHILRHEDLGLMAASIAEA